MVISAKARLVSVIVAVVFMFGALAGTGAYLIVNHLNNAKATTSTDYIIQDNLYNTNGTLNYQAVNDFLDAIGYFDNPNDTGTYKSYQIATRNTAATSGDTVVFKMGYYTEKNGTSTYTIDLVWQATYLWNGYLTIWLDKAYTVDYFNNGTSTSSGWGNASTNYSTYSNYSVSNIRDIVNNIYSALSSSLDNFSSFIVSPSEANATWQATQTEDVHSYSTSYYEHHNGLQSYSGSYTGWAQNLWNSSNPPYNDKFWIPSSVEVFNQSATNGVQVNNGLWGLTATDRGFATASYSGTTTSYCWLRSGYSNSNNYAMRVNSSGSAGTYTVYNSYGVRPAAHISLSSLASVAGSEIFASVASGATDRAQVSPSYQYYIRDSGAEMTVTYTANTGYYISQITVNNLDLTISASVDDATTFVDAGDFSYRCYRSDNQVIIIFANITTNLDVVGAAISVPITVNIDGSANYGSHSVNIDFDASTGNATVSITLSRVYPYSVALGSNSPQLINRWNDTVYQTSDAFAVTYQTNNYSTKIKFYIVEIDGQIVINLVTSNVQPTLEQGGGTSISGVALQVSASGGSTDLAAVGEARITGYNQTEDLTTIHVSAWASTGYVFVGWQVDGETISTLLSADIPYDDVEGKILVAVFEPINQNISNEVDNGYTDDFV